MKEIMVCFRMTGEQKKKLSNDLKLSEEEADILYQKGRKKYLGDGTRKVYKVAAEHFKEAAEKGNADAQCCLGVCYYLGKGVKKDTELARQWLVRSAQQGNAAARNDLLLWFREEKEAAQIYKPLASQLEQIKEWCSQITRQYPSFVVSPKLSSHLGIGSQAVYLGYDDTFFKSGKIGFAVTKKGFVVKRPGDAFAQTLTFWQFLKTKKLSLKENKIYADEQVAIWFSGNRHIQAKLLELCKTIKMLLLIP